MGHSTRLGGPLRPLQLLLLRPLLAQALRLIALNDSERDRFSRVLRPPIQRFLENQAAAIAWLQWRSQSNVRLRAAATRL
jgi:hypothetical protein